ncbi:hypothetical protein JW887_06990 [Candidatus Dojkabacteria bacterium]|nr:hypothetical protein [Candidatus Dojkabacteria bacterium]
MLGKKLALVFIAVALGLFTAIAVLAAEGSGASAACDHESRVCIGVSGPSSYVPAGIPQKYGLEVVPYEITSTTAVLGLDTVAGDFVMSRTLQFSKDVSQSVVLPKAGVYLLTFKLPEFNGLRCTLMITATSSLYLPVIRR